VKRTGFFTHRVWSEVSWEKEGTGPDRLLYDKSLIPSIPVVRLILDDLLGDVEPSLTGMSSWMATCPRTSY
jgi:hypothetical protein